MTLSDKMGNIGNAEYLFIEGKEPTNDYGKVILAKDVKEFIKELKEQLDWSLFQVGDQRHAFKIIDKLSGDKLI